MPRLGRQGHDPGRDPVQVDDGGRLVLSLSFSLSFVLVVFRLVVSRLLLGVGGPFLVALLQERIGRRLGERDQVDRGGRLHVGVGLVEPVVDRAGVGRGQEIEVLAALVESRLAGLGETVGHAGRLVVFDRVEPDLLEAGAIGERVSEPLRVGGPGVVGPRRSPRPVDRLGGDAFDDSALQVDPGEGAGVVDEGDLLAVGRPDWPLVEPGPVQGVGLAFSLAVLRANDQAVFAGRVGEIRDRLAVGRPGREAIVRAGRLGEVARIALLGGDRHDLAAVSEHGPLAARRDTEAPDVFRIAGEARAGSRQGRRPPRS